jgi:hypothetical protein
VLRRLDCVAAPTRETVLARRARFKAAGENIDPVLTRAAGE